MSVPDVLVIGLRAATFVAAFQAAGAAWFLWLFGDELAGAARPVAKLAARSAVAGLLLCIGHELAEPARLTGGLDGILSLRFQNMVLASNVGTAVAIRVLGLAMVGAGAAKPSRLGGATALTGATLVAASFAFVGHTATHEPRWPLAVLLIVHLIIVAFWFGALRPLLLATRHEEVGANGRLIERFSKLATWLVPVILLAGLGLAGLLLPSLAALREAYGLLLIAKVGGFAVLLALAALNKWRLGPRIGAGEAGALVAFRRSVVAEWWLIAAVLSVTAVMTALFSPGH